MDGMKNAARAIKMVKVPPAQYQTRKPNNSATGATTTIESGIMAVHIALVVPMTRPCISGATLLCTIA